MGCLRMGLILTGWVFYVEDHFKAMREHPRLCSALPRDIIQSTPLQSAFDIFVRKIAAGLSPNPARKTG
jgi:hypothetical protein